jgi:hypothetical protein
VIFIKSSAVGEENFNRIKGPKKRFSGSSLWINCDSVGFARTNKYIANGTEAERGSKNGGGGSRKNTILLKFQGFKSFDMRIIH